jgi:hypothetical protein
MKEKLNLTTLSKKEIKATKGGVICLCACSGIYPIIDKANSQFNSDWPNS